MEEGACTDGGWEGRGGGGEEREWEDVAIRCRCQNNTVPPREVKRQQELVV